MRSLTIGTHTILVDDEDFDRVSSRTWTVRGADRPRFLTHLRSGASRQRVSLARLIMNEFDSERFVTHRPHADALDYRKQSLMSCSMAQRQTQLKKRKAKSSSKYKGVSRIKKSGKWRASIRPAGKSIYLGEYVSEDDAALAYNKAAVIYFGENAFLNTVIKKPA